MSKCAENLHAIRAGRSFSLPALILRWWLVVHDFVETASQKPANPGEHCEVYAHHVSPQIMQKLCALYIRPGNKLILADSVRNVVLFQPQRNPAIIGIRHTITKERIPRAY